jgi:hypothetical protein
LLIQIHVDIEQYWLLEWFSDFCFERISRYSTSSIFSSGASQSSASNCDQVTYSYDSSSYGYVVLAPIITTNTRTVYQKQPDTVIQPPPVSCTTYENAENHANSNFEAAEANVNSINAKIAQAEALLNSLQNDLMNAQSQSQTAESTLNQTMSDLSSCQAQQAAAATPIVIPGQTIPVTQIYNTQSYVAVVVGGYDSNSCSSIPTTGKGRGTISSVNSDCINVSGLGQLNFGTCTSKSHKPGKSNFSVSENVSYETHNYGGKLWARNVSRM